jgi:hypothetical protein
MTNKNHQATGSETSARKAAANKQNAQHSTGPQTVSGKFTSSHNAIKLGFYSQIVVLPGEDLPAFQTLQQELWAALGPQNALEALWVKEIVETTWRLKRLGLVEAELFVRESISYSGDSCGVGFAFLQDATRANTFSKLATYEAALSRRFLRAMQNLRLLREKGWKQSPPDETAAAGDAANQIWRGTAT